MPCTFIIADNQSITRAGLHWMISDIMDSAEVFDAKDKTELLDLLKEHPQAVVVLDTAKFNFNGVDDFLFIRSNFSDVHWVLFSGEFREPFIRRMSVENDICMVLKDNEGEEIVMALKCAAVGGRYLCHQIANLLLARNNKRNAKTLLTATELDILKLVALGWSVKEIAEARVSSMHTIVTHKKNIFRKLGVKNIHDATRYALRTGVIDIVDYGG